MASVCTIIGYSLYFYKLWVIFWYVYHGKQCVLYSMYVNSCELTNRPRNSLLRVHSHLAIAKATSLKVCLHLPSPCPSPSPSKFIIVPMVTDRLRENVSRTHSICQCKFDGDVTRKWTLIIQHDSDKRFAFTIAKCEWILTRWNCYFFPFPNRTILVKVSAVI